MNYLFEPPAVRSISVQGETAEFPIRRIFCVGRNYEAHALEMGNVVDREAPFYFTKSAQAAEPSGSTLPYPPGSNDYHYEMELVVAIGAPVFRISVDAALRAVFGYGCGLDMTRRDLQNIAKDKRRPWDLAKDGEASAILGELSRINDFGALSDQRIHLSVNGKLKQDAKISDMIHSVPEIIADLSRYYHLLPGDLIMTGTPAGVGAVIAGDLVVGGIDGLSPVTLTLIAAE